MLGIWAILFNVIVQITQFESLGEFGYVVNKYLSIKAIALHESQHFQMCFSVVFLLVMFLSKLPRMQKHRKSNLIRMFFWRTKVSEAVSKRDWHNMRSYLFFNLQKFWTEISDSVCNDLLANKTTFASDMFRVFVFGSHTKIKLTLLKICLGYFLHLLVDLFKSFFFFKWGDLAFIQNKKIISNSFLINIE